MTPLLLLGSGGHCRSCIDVVERTSEFSVRGIVVKQRGRELSVGGYPILGEDRDLPYLLRDSSAALIAVGHLTDVSPRVRLYEALRSLGAELPLVSSPESYVSASAAVGNGTIVMHGSVVNAGAIVGSNCIINSRALLEHDVHVGDHCHVSTGVIINGGAEIGTRTFLGSGTIVREGVRIGSHCIIGAGSLVLSDVPEGAVVLGRS